MGNVSNLVPSNQRRREQAAERVIPAITALMSRHDVALPPKLAAVGRARLEHPEDTLAELGRRFDPPLSKDTVAGRLRRLAQLPT